MAYFLRSSGDLAAELVAHAGRRTWLAGAVMIGAALFEGAGLLLLVPIIGVLINGPLQGRSGHLLTALGISTTAGQMPVLVMLYIAAAIIRAQLTYARSIILGRLQLGFARSQRNATIERLAHAGWSRLAGMSHARIASLITNDVSRSVMSAQLLLQLAVAALILGVNVTVAMWLAPRLVLLLVLLSLLALAFLLFTGRDTPVLGSNLQRSGREMMGATADLLSGLKTALAQQQQDRFVREFERVQSEIFDTSFGFQHIQAGSRRLFGMVSPILAGGLVLGGYLLAVPPAKLLVVVLIMARIAGPVLQMQQTMQRLMFSLAGFDSIRQVHKDFPAPVVVTPDDAARLEGALELQDVAYRYQDGAGIGPLSLRIEPGEFLGIEGPSGTGKTTLIDVMAGLLEPQQGRLLVDGLALDGQQIRRWQRNLAYLGQEVFLFNESIRANLTWAAEQESDEEIWNALDLAGAADLVRALADGLDTRAGERGELLSGGERQRIALARCLLRKPGFLLLDEATSAIDIESERQLLERLVSLRTRPTIVMVAHRRESLLHCGRIVTMRDGKIVARREKAA